MARKVIQIAFGRAKEEDGDGETCPTLFAVCDDGKVYALADPTCDAAAWLELTEVPQD